MSAVSDICQTPEVSVCFCDPIQIWNHTILEEDNFMTQCQASLDALDLAFELNTIMQPVCEVVDLSRARRPHHRAVRFEPQVDLYVGSELDLDMSPWKHTLGVPHRRAAVFHNELNVVDIDTDVSSFMAVPGDFTVPVQHRQGYILLMNDAQAVQQEDDQFVNVQVQVTDDSDQDSWSSIAAPTSNWQTTLIFALNRQATSLRLDWMDYESMHASIARELGVDVPDLYHVHHIKHGPQDLFRAYVEPVIAHRAGDLAIGSPERMVLVDVEFHSSRVATIPDVVRQVHKFIEPITRERILQKLGLRPFCHRVTKRCLMWQNNQLVPLGCNNIMIMDGDYFRIALPPGDPTCDHVATRYLATAFHRGMSLDEILQQQALSTLGWLQHTIQPPWVPIPHDADETNFLQRNKMNVPALPDVPLFQRQAQHRILGQCLDTLPSEKVELEIEYPQVNEDQEHREQVLGGVDEPHPLLEQPFAIQVLHEHWLHLTTGQDFVDEPSVPITTWFLDFPRIDRCLDPREVRLYRDFQQRFTMIVDTWRDSIDNAWPLNLYVVHPTPPTTRDTVSNQIHLLVVQRTADGTHANVFTRIDTTESAPRVDMALFAPAVLDKYAIIHTMEYDYKCHPERSHLQCMVWHGDFELRGRIAARNRPGLSFVMIYNHIPNNPDHVATLDIWDAVEDEEALLQTSMRTSRRTTAPMVLTLDELIGSTTAVRLIDGSGHNRLPNPIEVAVPGHAEQIEAELQHWGHHCKAYMGATPAVFLCLDCHEQQHERSMGFHYFFCHDDLDDDSGHFLHSDVDILTEEQVMRLLCSLGYARAVLLQYDHLHDNWYRIVFHHREPATTAEHNRRREPSTWPPRTQHRKTDQPLIVGHFERQDESRCSLTTSFDTHDLEELFASGWDILVTDFEVLQLEDAINQQIQCYPICPLTQVCDLDQYDRLLIYTDGSSLPTMRRMSPACADDRGHPDTWAFVVIAETFLDEHSSNITILGWTAQPVRYDVDGSAFTGVTRIGSDMAERSALIGAAMWRLSLNHGIPTVFCTDSELCGGQARGNLGATVTDESYRLLRGLFQTLDFALPGHKHFVHQVRAHVGDLFNEIADQAAKTEAKKSYMLPRQRLNMQMWRERFEELWTVFGERYGMPSWHDGAMNVHAPDLPEPDAPYLEGPPRNKQLYADFSCSFGTANVQSLSRGPLGGGGKLHYLQQQMREYHLNCMALQETRTEEGVMQSQNILRLCSGHDKGHFGIELWIDLDMPIGHHANKKPLRSAKDHFQVVHKDPRRLLVRCDTGHLSFWMFAGHAPHNGHDANTRQQWWADVDELLHIYVDSDPIVLMMDANAEPGEKDGMTVLRDGFATSLNTPHFKKLLATWDLFLPVTSDFHCGSCSTWTSIDGQTEHCIDHIAVSNSWFSRCMTSQVLPEFDLATINDDHKVVALQLQWKEVIYLPCGNRNAGPFRTSQSFTQGPSVGPLLEAIPPLPWHADVEKQALSLTDGIHGALRQQQTKPPGIHKPFIDERIWTMRASKLHTKKRLRHLQKQRARQLLQRWFCIWSRGVENYMQNFEAAHNYDTTLLCHQLHLVVQLKQVSLNMKKAMAMAKSKALHEEIVQQADQISATELLRRLRRFTGPSNPKKQKGRTLPMIKDADGQVCTLPSEAVGVWVRFFQDMECGSRMSYADLRSQWLQELQSFEHKDICLSMKDIPSLTDLEAALRRVPQGRACGPDGIPGEVCRHNPTILAKLLFPQLAKMAIHGHEHLGFKGGRLTPAYKGRGPTDQCASYRSLLVSNHLGKTMHRALRQKHAVLYETFLQAQQTGGRRKIPVQIAVHQLRALHRHCHANCKPMGILYLDLTEAFYRILREFPIGGEATDELVAHVLRRLGLPPESTHDIHALLQERCALSQAGMHERDRNAIQAIHTSTHFWVHGQCDISRTTMGTRPGDCMADWIFGFAWAVVLKKVQAFMIAEGINEPLPGHDLLPLFGRQGQNDQSIHVLGPNWMDDLALCVHAPACDVLVSDMGKLASFLLDTCEYHCMSPNLKPGKTEILFDFRGKQSRTFKTQFYGPNAPKRMPIVCEKGTNFIQLVTCYRHLGGMTHHSSDLQAEIRHRAAIAHGTMNQHRRVLFQNPDITLGKRAELFDMLVMTKLLYGAESWLAKNERTQKSFHNTVLHLYKRLARIKPDDHKTDDEVLVTLGLPHPEELLRRARLRYLALLEHSGLSDKWAILALDTEWRAVLEEDFIWMWTQLKNASHLPHPAEGYEQWLFLIQNSPGYWKRLVKRAGMHAIHQRRKRQQVIAFHQQVLPQLWSLSEEPPLTAHVESSGDGAQHYGCLMCHKRCRSLAGEAAHMCKVHGIVASVRFLFDQPTCGACLKHFHTMQKMKAHLHYSRLCRERLLSRNVRCELVPGTGSQLDRDRNRSHDRMLPPLTGEGPQLPPARLRVEQGIDHDLHMHLVNVLTDSPCEMLEMQWRAFCDEHAISWTLWTSTIQFFKDTLQNEDADLLDFDLMAVNVILDRLCQPDSWAFLKESHRRRPQQTIEILEEECAMVEQRLETEEIVVIPRVFGKTRLVLHAYSGRRRIGDVQYFIDLLAAKQTEYDLQVISMDIINDPLLGDAMNPRTCELWYRAVRQRHVIAFIGGPPCESWSCARGQMLEQEHSGPRVVRDLMSLWGFACLRLRELEQITVGNALLMFAIIVIVELIMVDGFAILEHPGEPLHDHMAASIWRLPILRALAALPNVQVLRIAQGLMGSASPKPTNILALNMPELLSFIHSNRVRVELPKNASIGKGHDGKWKTAALKEYAPALCKSFAQALMHVVNKVPVDTTCPAPTQTELAQYQAMVINHYGEVIGADFAHRF